MSGGSEQAITHIRECRRDLNQNKPYRGINLTNMTYMRPWIGHVWQPFSTIP
jgi:hypothetical protein